MERKTHRRPSQYTRRYNSRNRLQNEPESTRLGNQLSIAVLLCVFFIAVACIRGSTAENIRLKASHLIGENVLEDYEPSGNISENISEFVRCMLSYTKDNPEEKIKEDMQNEISISTDVPTNTPASVDNSDSASDDSPPE